MCPSFLRTNVQISSHWTCRKLRLASDSSRKSRQPFPKRTTVRMIVHFVNPRQTGRRTNRVAFRQEPQDLNLFFSVEVRAHRIRLLVCDESARMEVSATIRRKRLVVVRPAAVCATAGFPYRRTYYI